MNSRASIEVDGLRKSFGTAEVLDGVQVAGPATHVPPERRRIGMVFQDWALFPHLTVAQNVAYGLPRPERRLAGRSGRARRTGRAGRAGARGTSRVDEVLDMVGLGGLRPPPPGTLSGGPQQRVALARALAPRPAVLLGDRPLSQLAAPPRPPARA